MTFLKQINRETKLNEHVLTDGQIDCTYGQMPEVFNRLSIYFSQQGICPETAVILECENSLFGALTLLYLLENSYSTLVVPPEKEDSQTPAFCKFRIKTGRAQDLEDPAAFLNISENTRWNGQVCAQEKAELFLRTSGSTGPPKMVAHSHTALKQNAVHCLERLGLTHKDRIAIPVPIFHLFGMAVAFLPAVMAGACVDLQQGANLLKYMSRERLFNPNVAFMTPVFCESLLKVRKSPRPYRLTITAGDKFRGAGSFEKYESLFGCLVNLYGSTEMGAISSSSPKYAFLDRKETAGMPITGVDLCIKEQKDGSGQVWCRNEFGFSGYVDTNKEAIQPDPDREDGYFFTGDLGRIRPDGRIQILGRSDHKVNRDGILVLFADVESAIKQIKGVESVVVVPHGESTRGKGMVACCLCEKEAGLTQDEIKTACLNLLPRRAVPDNILIFKDFPLLPSGKVNRKELEKAL